MKYATPKLFNPTPEEQKAAALEAAKLFSPDKVLVTKAGDRVRGTRKQPNIKSNKL